MKLLKEISDKDIKENPVTCTGKYGLRRAARAVVINDLGQVALMHASKSGYFKLPGGGIESGEGIYDALIREIREEVGVEIDILSDIGVIIEYRDEIEFLQISYCYYCKARDGYNKPNFTEEEMEEGFELLWMTIDEAIKKVEHTATDDYGLKYIQMRDSEFLKQVQGVINN